MTDATLGLVSILVFTAVATAGVTIAWRFKRVRDAVAQAEARRREQQGSGGSGG